MEIENFKNRGKITNLELIVENGQNGAILRASNLVNRELMAIRSAACCEEDVKIYDLAAPLLLDFFGLKHIEELSSLGRRLFFESTLFQPQLLPRAIREISNFGNDLQMFFEYAFIYYQDKHALKIEKESSADTLVFICTQWQRALQYIQQEGIQQIGEDKVSDLMLQVRNKMKKLLKDADFQGNSLQQHLHLALLDSYQQDLIPTHNLVEDVIISLFSYHQLVQIENQSSTLTPAFIKSALQTPIKLRGLIADFLQNHSQAADQVFRKVAKIHGIKLPKQVHWKPNPFPVYHCQYGDHTLEIVLLTGRVLLDGKESLPLSSNVRDNSRLYLELFGNRRIDGIEVGDYFQASDDKGKIEIATKTIPNETTEIIAIKRIINGKWYTFIGKHEKEKHPPMPPLAGLDKLSLWFSFELRHFIFVDTATMTPVIRLDEDATITFLQENGKVKWKWVEDAVLDGKSHFRTLDPSTFILQQDTIGFPRKMRLQLPHLADPSGQTIEFMREIDNRVDTCPWVMKNKPHLSISSDQTLPGIRNFHNFLILENTSGNREVYIPIKSKTELDENQIVHTGCISANIKNGNLISFDVKSNLYLAYAAFTQAITPEDYLHAMEFLQKAHKFERYEAEELRLLGWIFHSEKRTNDIILQADAKKITNDNTPQADALRLFAAWLVKDNFKRNPKLKEVSSNAKIRLTPSSSKEEWQNFWEESLEEENLSEQIAKLAQHYFASQHHLAQGMRIQDLLSPQELMDWSNLETHIYSKILGTFEKESILVSIDDVYALNRMTSEKKSVRIPIKSRPKEYLNSEFPALLDAAASNDPQRRKVTEDQFTVMQFDPESRLLSAILLAALKSGENAQANKILGITREIMQTFFGSLKKEEIESLRKDLQEAFEGFSHFIEIQKPSRFPVVPNIKILPPNKEIVLPEIVPPDDQLPFEPPGKPNIPKFERLFNKCFETISSTDSDEEIEPFTFVTDDPWLNKKLEEFNEDYFTGIQKNREKPRYQLKEGMESLLSKSSKGIVQEAEHYSDKVVQERQNVILYVANKPPSDKKNALLFQSESASGRRRNLTIEDCVGLFLQGSIDAYKASTGLSRREDIIVLHNKIGDYILLHNKAIRYQAVVKAFKRLDQVKKSAHTRKQLSAALHKVAEELSVSQVFDPATDPRALMVFEYALDLTIKQHQIDGVREMLKILKSNSTYSSVLLQCIQGGGKSLVWGHIMAFLKADGYHLSVHVPATAQYQTSTYDMKHHSEHIFGQRERTLVFDDDPLKFTPEYLTWIEEMFKECIVNREYVTITNESLRAMRCKYLKTRFEIMQGDVELEKSNQILKRILFLLRTRGAFTFDEMHKALDPLKELNMPYGRPEYPKIAECRLISRMISAACRPNEKGKIFLNPQQSALQTPEQYQAMKQQVIDDLMQDPEWNDPGIAAYLSGEMEDIPEILEKPENHHLVKLVILARQLLVGEWLKERFAIMSTKIMVSQKNASHVFPFPLSLT